MQRLRRSSGELDVFGATRYFADRVDGAGLVGSTEPRLIQGLLNGARMEGSNYEAPERALATAARHRHLTFLRSLLSPPKASSEKKGQSKYIARNAASSASCACTTTASPGRAEAKLSLSSSRKISSVSMRYDVHGCGDLGGVMRDTRLEGVWVVSEERWVVRCRAWEDESKCVASEVEGQDDCSYDMHGWGSDSSSDLFELEDLSS